jgi:hypothetical protein
MGPELFCPEDNCMRDALRNMTTVLSSVSTPMIVLLLLTVIAPLPWLLVQNATKKAAHRVRRICMPGRLRASWIG